MGVVIKSKIDGFRRGGIAHRVEGTYYPDGVLSEQQLAVMRADPNLLVVEGVQEDALQANQGSAEQIQELGEYIASLEQELDEIKAGRVLIVSSLEQARSELEAARSERLVALDRLLALPGLVVEEAKLLVPADPTQEGAICILADSLVALITAHLQPQQKAPEAQDDGIQSTLSIAGESTSPAPGQAVAPATGDKPEAVSGDKLEGKRTRNKGA